MSDRRRATTPTAALSTAGRALVLGAVLLAATTCGHAGVPFPWPGSKNADRNTRSQATPARPRHAEVVTANKGYRRRGSAVLVRNVARATRANLDYAAYHANFMNADPDPEVPTTVSSASRPDASTPFDGALDARSLTGDFASLPLSPEERARPLAIAPLVELLVSKHVPGGEVLEDVAARVRAEDWGLGGGPQLVRQTAVAAYLHEAGAGKPVEVWVQIELAPWFRAFDGVPDADHDGFGELYGRVPQEALGDKTAALVTFIGDEYVGRALSVAEVKGWAHQLASYWYPSYNTDLATAGPSWPDDETEAEIVAELGGQRFSAPTVVMRGKPQGKPVYNVFMVAGLAEGAAATTRHRLRLPRSTPSPDPAPTITAIEEELAAHGGSWSRWSAEVSPLHELMRRKLHAIPAGAKAIAGSDGFLFFGQSLAYITGGDLEKQRRGRNPVPAILQFKKLLAQRGVDLLFVPVPTKEEIFPDKLATSDGERRTADPFVGKVVNPYQRKLLMELGEKGVEVVDLFPLFLRERELSRGGGKGKPSNTESKTDRETVELYQAQDTHWTNKGLALAARAVAERVRGYPWYKGLVAHRTTFKSKEVRFTRHGDLHSRLPEADKSRYRPESLVGEQVRGASGNLYEDDPDSPIVLLGDSFTGVYQLMDCEHAGVSAHLAKELGHPVDLVMSYGGGPNVRQKLLRRGAQALEAKKLVIWMMTARDLFDFWEGWQPVTAK